jgi:hypothetical protein
MICRHAETAGASGWNEATEVPDVPMKEGRPILLFDLQPRGREGAWAHYVDWTLLAGNLAFGIYVGFFLG